jgi:myo-inositol-1(or 4)-monophosphatase
MPEIPTSELLAVAIEACRTGGEHARANKDRRSEAIYTGAHDVKLALDVECQARIEAVIRSSFPDHMILGEEDETSVNGNRLGDDKPGACQCDTYEWIVDPIDGTVNFSHGFPIWCCSVAVRHGEAVLAGAVFAPDMDALYTATVDQAATRNGEPIQVSTRNQLSESIVMTGLDKNLVPGAAPLQFFTNISANCRKARVAGSAALDLCWVAEGIADGYFEGSIYLWDVAAAGLIVQQAGGTGEVVTSREEPYQISYVASNGRIHEALKALVSV